METGSYAIAVVVGLLFLIVLVFGTRRTYVQSPDDSAVVVVPLGYACGKYALESEVQVLPCVSPNRLQDESETDSLVEVYGGGTQQTVIERFRIRNPRINGGFEAKEAVGCRDEGTFTLFFPLREGMQTLAFWESPRQQQEPSVVVDLSEAIALYHAAVGPYQQAEVQPPEPAFERDARSEK